MKNSAFHNTRQLFYMIGIEREVSWEKEVISFELASTK